MKEVKRILCKLLLVSAAVGMGVLASYLLTVKNMATPAGVLLAMAVGILFLYEEPYPFWHYWRPW